MFVWLRLLYCALKHDEEGKFYVMCVFTIKKWRIGKQNNKIFQKGKTGVIENMKKSVNTHYCLNI